MDLTLPTQFQGGRETRIPSAHWPFSQAKIAKLHICTHADTHGRQMRDQAPELELGVPSSQPCGCWELKSGPLEEHKHS